MGKLPIPLLPIVILVFPDFDAMLNSCGTFGSRGVGELSMN